MRYRRKIGAAGVIVWFAYAAITALAFYRSRHSVLSGAVAAIVVLLLFYVPHLYWYWEILPDRLVHRSYFQRTVWPFQEITYIGPLSGKLAASKAAKNWIEIRNASGQRMIAQPADTKAFLDEMRRHLPEITLNL
jgi:hypothetical protein